MTIHRIVEQEAGFTPILEFLPSLSRELLDENRSWLEPEALDPATGMAVLCFQSYVVKTPHHTIWWMPASAMTRLFRIARPGIARATATGCRR